MDIQKTIVIIIGLVTAAAIIYRSVRLFKRKKNCGCNCCDRNKDCCHRS